MSKWNVYNNPEQLKELYSKTSFNYKDDVKKLSKEQLNSISEEIGNQILNGLSGGSAEIYITKDRKVSYAKIRVQDEKKENGKSKGFRCIVLIDYVNKAAYILHVYMHGKGNDKLKQKDKNKLRVLVDEYRSSL